MVEYEYRVVSFTRTDSRSDIRRTLTEHAEYGHWELHRTRIYLGGQQRTWLRRKIGESPITSIPLNFGSMMVFSMAVLGRRGSPSTKTIP